jgi:hypothetical protein
VAEFLAPTGSCTDTSAGVPFHQGGVPRICQSWTNREHRGSDSGLLGIRGSGEGDRVERSLESPWRLGRAVRSPHHPRRLRPDQPAKIVYRLVVSVRTAEGYLYRAGAKLGTSDRTKFAVILHGA